MKRATLPWLLLGLAAVLSTGTAKAESDFYMDVRVGTGNSRYYPYPDRNRYPSHYQPYNELRQWLQYEDRRYRDYDRWWRNQSSYYRQRTRMQHDYARQLRQDMHRYPNWQSIQRMESFLRRYYDPYAYSYNSGAEYRDPYYGGSYYDNDNSYYPDDSYYENAPRRSYYGNNYNYDRYDREADTYAYGTGHGITDLVRGSNRGNDLQTWSGALTTTGNILGIVNNERERDRSFGRYYR